MIELNVLKLLLNKQAYDKYIRHVKVPDELKKHYSVLDKLHTSFSERDLTLDEYVLHLQQAGCKYIDTLKDANVAQDSLESLIKTLSERSWAHTLALLSVEVSEGRKTPSDVLEHVSLLDSLIEKQEERELFVTDDLEELSKTTGRQAGLNWRLQPLQAALGGLNKGDFGFIFARVEVGKTSFLASEVSHFANQVDRPILWINNEERGDKVKTRIYQAYFGITIDKLFSNKKYAQEKFLTETKGMLKLYDRGVIHKRDVEQLFKEYNPSLVIIDQIDKIKGFKADRDDLVLGAIYIWARELAKEYCPIIGVTQASVSGENKRWLTTDDIAKSKTEKAAEADFIIGIGKTHDEGMEDIRFLHLVKNKLTGLHSKIECRINPTIARYETL